jgi:hypothetical protein
MKLDLVRGDSQGARQFLIGLSPGLFVSGIDQYSFLTNLDPIYKYNRANSRWLHLFVLPVSSFRSADSLEATSMWISYSSPVIFVANFLLSPCCLSIQVLSAKAAIRMPCGA